MSEATHQTGLDILHREVGHDFGILPTVLDALADHSRGMPVDFAMSMQLSRAAAALRQCYGIIERLAERGES